MKKRILALLCGLALALNLAACGGSSGSTAEAAPDNDAPAEAAETADTAEGGETDGAAEQVEVNMAVFIGNNAVDEFWDNFLEVQKEVLPHINIQLDRAPGDANEDYIKTRIAGDDFPDMMWVYQPALLINNNLLAEMPDELYDMLPNPEAFMVDGKLYTMPLHQGMLGMWYNKSIFAEAGIEKVPETWDEYMEALQKIEDIGVEPLGMTAAEGWFIEGNWAFNWAPATYGADENWSLKRNEGEVLFNNETTRRSLEQLSETIPYWQLGALSASSDEVKSLFFTGEVAIHSATGTQDIAIVNSGQFSPDFEIGYMTMPQDDASQRRVNTFQDNLWVISSAADDAVYDACVELLKLFYSEEIYQLHLNTQSAISSVKQHAGMGPEISNELSQTMLDEILAAAEEFGTVEHAHAAQGDNMWPAGVKEMAEIIVQEVGAGNTDYESLMNLVDDQWDIGLEQAE